MEVRRGEVRRRDWHRVTRGGYVRSSGDAADLDQVQRLAAWQVVLPADAAFTHVTAAAILGWWLPQLPRHVPVFVQVPQRRRVRRDEVRLIRTDSSRPPLVVGGLRVAAAPDVLLACALDLGELDLDMVVDSALRSGDARAQVERAARERRRGAPALHAALARADPRSESAWETTLRRMHETIDVRVVPQHRVEHDGRFVARGDLWIVGSRTLQEYDGAVHRTPKQQEKDLRRDRELNAAGWVRNGYTSKDLVKRPITVLRDADRALGRPTDPTRLDAWTALLRTSCLTPAGRARLARRWPTTDDEQLDT